MKKLLIKFVKDEKGINTVEIVVLVAIAIGLALIFRDQITSFLQSIFAKIFNPDAIIPTAPTPTP
ncbi:MAG: Flp1 family type IVb pilin [Ruminiclostridium sp.]|nr:Flp1 family type IVb pilin [Ruminiclostridium sp.]